MTLKLITPYSKELEAHMQELYNRLPEKNRRLYAGVEALKLSNGGISYIAELFNCSRDTIRLGIKELRKKGVNAIRCNQIGCKVIGDSCITPHTVICVPLYRIDVGKVVFYALDYSEHKAYWIASKPKNSKVKSTFNALKA